MKEIDYKNFSFQTHQKNWNNNKPNVCQFEITFKCALHCQHCYSDCYNNPDYIKKELKTKEIKFILDRAYHSGVIWLCLTGGDPLAREDFFDIYAYAQKKGFLTAVFTNGYSMTQKIADYFKRCPPFVIEVTLNAVRKKTYEAMSGVGGSFEKAMSGIAMLAKNKIPLKIKTQITKQNLKEWKLVKKFAESLGVGFKADPLLHARLNGDTGPCRLRVAPKQVLEIYRKTRPLALPCDKLKVVAKNNRLFRCAIGSGDGFCVDPYGNMLTCRNIRRSVVNLLKNEIPQACNELFPKIKMKDFVMNSRCRYCALRNLCRLCPGWALLETGNIESHVEYFCQLAYLTKKRDGV